MPFIAITERAFTRSSTSSTTCSSAASQVHERLERLVIEGRGLEAVLRAPWARGRRGRDREDARRARARPATSQRARPERAALEAWRRDRRARVDRPAAFAPEHAVAAGPRAARPVPGRHAARPQAWLIVVASAGRSASSSG